MAFVTPFIFKPSTAVNSIHPSRGYQKQLLSQNRTRLSLVSMTLDVLVTGAAGRAGSLVFELLQNAGDKFSVTGLVRDKSKAAEKPQLKSGQLIEGDIKLPETLVPAMEGKDALVVLTSAVPRLEPPKEEGMPPSFYFEAGGMPEDVDWLGARTQIDLAKSLKLKHIVFVGSMGSTDENNALNKLGNGNILKFKRKAETYLIDSGVPYTIINPAGLLDTPPNERELIVGRADEIFELYARQDCGISRADVARVVVSALETPSARNKAFDLASKPVGHGEVTKDPSSLFEETYATL